MKITRFITFSVFYFLLSTFAFPQGSLTPPGAPAPTMKTLDQIEARTPLAGGTTPLIVSQPGSYYLTGNLSITGGSGTNGITIYVSNVTIDLNGFGLAGSGATSGVGVIIAGGESNITIRNGTIRNCGSHGINGAGNSKVRAENLRVSNNGGNGILADVNAVVINCIAESNVGAGIAGTDNCLVKDSQAIATTGANSIGISVGTGGVVTGCVARGNTGGGIAAGSGCTLSNCTASYNTGGSSSGIGTGAGSVLTNCTAFSNTTATAINAGTANTLTNCTAYSNTTGVSAMIANTGSTLTNCSASYNTASDGINTGDGCTLTNCAAVGNTSSNSSSSGINAGGGCTLLACSVVDTTNTNPTPSNSTGVGILMHGHHSTIKDCTVRNNKGDGILVQSGCILLNNTCAFNGTGVGSGIHATGRRNRIEGNAAIDNPTGFTVDLDGNLIIKNSNRGGGATFTLAAGNSVGAMIDVFNGGAGATITSTNSWANFLY